ncbi:MAG: glycosyltransferase family 4 protein [Azoarcus sp.]|jgi:Fuc2NAc and GlcNAc transferase|nr:glycosyltransferase family 4 protein [Azoarcus sp.]
MTDLALPVLLAVPLVLSFVLTALLRRYALARRMIDIPTSRSSHTQPTPRGGGAAIVAGFFVALWLADETSSLSWALAGGGGLVALIGFIDDHQHVAVRWRLLIHFAAAGVVAWLAPPFSAPAFLPAFPGLASLLLVAGVFFLVWMVNLYNFMDGIDGLASIEALCVLGCGAALLGLDHGADALPPLLLAAAVAGFLFWNWPRARIFMGDACSGFLGMAIGVFALFPPAGRGVFWIWMILAGVFICDASLTLARRAINGERIHEAHRQHAYQHAARRWGHFPVTLAVAVIDLCWLFPLAALAWFGKVPPVAALLVAYAPLVVLAYRFRAGQREVSSTSI